MVMMEQAFWLILFLAVVGIAALIAAAMMWQKESIQQPGTPTGQRSYQEEYSAPDFTESAGFAVTMYPSTDILIPGRFWLINRKTAEIEYNVIPAGGVRLRVAQTGQLDVPDTYLAYQYESVATVLIDGTEVTLSQNPGRNAMASWTRNGFDYLGRGDPGFCDPDNCQHSIWAAGHAGIAKACRIRPKTRFVDANA